MSTDTEPTRSFHDLRDFVPHLAGETASPLRAEIAELTEIFAVGPDVTGVLAHQIAWVRLDESGSTVYVTVCSCWLRHPETSLTAQNDCPHVLGHFLTRWHQLHDSLRRHPEVIRSRAEGGPEGEKRRIALLVFLAMLDGRDVGTWSNLFLPLGALTVILGSTAELISGGLLVPLRQVGAIKSEGQGYWIQPEKLAQLASPAGVALDPWLVPVEPAPPEAVPGPIEFGGSAIGGDL